MHALTGPCADVKSGRRLPFKWQMAQLHLPVGHSAEELAIAGALAERLEAAELYVTWSGSGGPARPAICAAIRGRRASVRRRRPRLAALLDSLRGRVAQA